MLERDLVLDRVKGTKNKFPGQNIDSSILYFLCVKHSFFLYINIAKSLIWHPPMFLYLTTLISFSHWSSSPLPVPPESHYHGDYSSPSFSSIFPINPAHIPAYKAALTASRLCFWSPRRKQWKGLLESVCKVYSSAQECPGPELSLTHPERLQSCKLHSWQVPYIGVPYCIFYPIFLLYLLYV